MAKKTLTKPHKPDSAQAGRFEQAARELSCDENPVAFDKKIKAIAEKNLLKQRSQ